MDYTEVRLHSYSVNGDSPGEVKYRIQATCEEPGELPTTFIFAYRIVDQDDSSSDVFDHVATVHEVQNVIKDRDDAIAADEDIYFLTFSQFTYTDLGVATQARAQLKTRLNELTRVWIQYRDDFFSAEALQLFPSSAPEIEQELIDAYASAKEARQAAEVAVAEADAAVTDAQADIDNASEFVAVYTTEDATLVNLQNLFSDYVDAIVTEGSLALGKRATYESAMVSAISAARANLQTWMNTKAARQQVYEEAIQTKIEADQELTAAQALEDIALEAALAANPDFDPDSV